MVGGWRALGGLASAAAFVALGASAGCSHETAANRQVATTTTTTMSQPQMAQTGNTQQQVNELQRQLANQKRATCLAEVAKQRAEKSCQMQLSQAQSQLSQGQGQMGQGGMGQGQMAQRPCPAPQTKLLTIPSDLLFGFDEDTLLPNANQRLDKAVSALQIDPQQHIIIVGHADSVGDPDYNVDLSERRAKAVGQYLIDHGVSQDRLQIEGKGANDPIADNDTPEGRATNRRVELYVQRGTTQF